MNEEKYKKVIEVFRKSRTGVYLLRRLDFGITWITIIAYVALLVYLFFTDHTKCYPVLIIPGICFGIITVFRNVYSAKRPYEVFDILPLIEKETKGKSFPSRHVFSIFMIGMTYWFVCKPIAILLFVLGVILGLIRVIAGLHYPRDVIAGMLVALIGGGVGLYSFF